MALQQLECLVAQVAKAFSTWNIVTSAPRWPVNITPSSLQKNIGKFHNLSLIATL